MSEESAEMNAIVIIFTIFKLKFRIVFGNRDIIVASQRECFYKHVEA